MMTRVFTMKSFVKINLPWRYIVGIGDAQQYASFMGATKRARGTLCSHISKATDA